MKHIVVFILCIPLLSAAPCVFAEDNSENGAGSFFSKLSSSEHMTGDWGGLRDRLIEWGLTPTAYYSSSLLGNPVGGMRKGIKYAGLLDVYLDFDLEKLLSIKNTRLVVSGSWAFGESLSAGDIGNFFTVSNDYNGKSVSLYQLYLETELWHDRLTLAIGRMGIGDDFAKADILCIFVSSSVDQNPISIQYNIPAFLSNPDAALGAHVRVQPSDAFYLAAGVYNANSDAGRNTHLSIHTDFTFGDGVILISEAGYTPGSAGGSAGLPGEYKLGAYYDTGKFNELADFEDTRNGNYGFYLIADQMVYGEYGDGDQGLTLWTASTFAPEDSINLFPFFLSGGFAYEGLLPGRNEDTAAFGIAYGKVSRDFEDGGYEIGIEGTYIIQLTPWLGLQPDVQVIVHPGGSSGIPNALVAGMQLSVDI